MTLKPECGYALVLIVIVGTGKPFRRAALVFDDPGVASSPWLIPALANKKNTK